MRKPLIILAKLVLALLSVAGMGLLIAAGWLIWHYEYGLGLPSEDRLATMSSTGPACTTDLGRTYVPLAEVPPLLRKAVIAYEQSDFYEAWSLNPFVEFALAAAANRRPGASSGVMQSVTKCLMSLSPTCCRGLDWHIGTIFFMQRVASSLSRDRSLEIYLNESYLGRGARGVAAAAETYFGKPLSELNIDEVAFIASRTRHPQPSRDFDTRSRDFAIDRMLTAGLISEAQAASSKSRPLLLKDKPPGGQNTPLNQ
jgi:membrane carboxypeptidase/penicillin-binding protein